MTKASNEVQNNSAGALTAFFFDEKPLCQNLYSPFFSLKKSWIGLGIQREHNMMNLFNDIHMWTKQRLYYSVSRMNEQELMIIMT